MLQFHEHLGYRLDRIDALQQWISGTPIRKWDDMVLILYGLAALPLAIHFLPSALRRPRVVEFLALATLFYAIHTLIDAVVEPRTTLSVMCEESAKLFCAAFLALAMLAGLLGLQRPSHGGDDRRSA